MPPIDFYQSIRSTSTPSNVRNLGAGAGQLQSAESPASVWMTPLEASQVRRI